MYLWSQLVALQVKVRVYALQFIWFEKYDSSYILDAGLNTLTSSARDFFEPQSKKISATVLNSESGAGGKLLSVVVHQSMTPGSFFILVSNIFVYLKSSLVINVKYFYLMNIKIGVASIYSQKVWKDTFSSTNISNA